MTPTLGQTGEKCESLVHALRHGFAVFDSKAANLEVFFNRELGKDAPTFGNVGHAQRGEQVRLNLVDTSALERDLALFGPHHARNSA